MTGSFGVDEEARLALLLGGGDGAQGEIRLTGAALSDKLGEGAAGQAANGEGGIYFGHAGGQDGTVF